MQTGLHLQTSGHAKLLKDSTGIFWNPRSMKNSTSLRKILYEVPAGIREKEMTFYDIIFRGKVEKKVPPGIRTKEVTLYDTLKYESFMGSFLESSGGNS